MIGEKWHNSTPQNVSLFVMQQKHKLFITIKSIIIEVQTSCTRP